MMKMLRWGNVLLVLATLLSYLSPYVSPATFWPLAFFGLIYPWLLLANLLFLAFWALLRKYQFLLSLSCLLLGWNPIMQFFGLHLNSSPEEETVLWVKCFNAYGFRDDLEGGKRYPAERLSEVFPVPPELDVLCLQEFPSVQWARNDFLAHFTEQTPLQHKLVSSKGALAIFSRYPIKDSHTRYFFEDFNGYQYADLEVGSHTIRVFNLHLQSNSVSSMASEVARDGNLQERETWLNIRAMAANFKRSATKRATQAEEIAQAIADSPHPVVLCGDLNAVPQSYTYHQIAQHLVDGFRQAGKGFGTTYAGAIPALRIDYIFHSPVFRALDYQVAKEQFSEHYSVSAALQLK